MKEVKPISASVKAKRHTRQYQMHKYFARRPYNVFANLINHYSEENDIVLDCFCGGGVTVYESIAQNRKSIGVDLNPLATFITEMQIFDGDITDVEKLYDDFIKNMKSKYQNIYYVKFDDDEGYIEWMEWAYKTKCPECNTKIILSEENKVRNGYYKSANEDCTCRLGIKRLDTIPDGIETLRIKYFSKKLGSFKVKEYTDVLEVGEAENYLNSQNTNINPDVELPLDMDRQFEDRLKEKGIIYYSDLFTKRNFYVNVILFNEILNLKGNLPDVQLDQLYFLFSSSLRYSNNMTRVTKNWEGGNPTSMDKHAFWLPNQFVENNIFSILEKRSKAIIKGFKYSKENLMSSVEQKFNFESLINKGDYLILNQSSSELNIPDNSIDVIITDPPYGSNVQYAELSIIWNVWYEHYKKKETYLYVDEEAVMNRRLPEELGRKDSKFYEEMLYNVFRECYRVLKPKGYLVFTFNNKNINVWIAMLKAVARAGFVLPNRGVLFQDYIDSYKNTAHLRYEGNLHGDFVYSFRKVDDYIEKPTEYDSLKDLLNDVVENISKNIMMESKEVLTTDLYQEIFASSAGLMMSYIQENLECEDIIEEEFSKTYIDEILSKYLVYEEGHWKKETK